MVTLADFSDTQFLMTCKRCEQTLQEGDRFCRYCGQDQLEGDPAAVIDITQPASNSPGDAPTPTAAWRAGRRDAWREPSLAQGFILQQPGDAPDGRPGGTVAPRRWSMGLAAAVLLALAAVLAHDLYLILQEDAMRDQRNAQSAPAVQQQTAPALPQQVPAATSESPAAPVAAGGSEGSPVQPGPGTSVSAAADPHGSSAPPAPQQPAPAAAVPPAAPAQGAAAPPAAEPPPKRPCPDALAALALCPD